MKEIGAKIKHTIVYNMGYNMKDNLDLLFHCYDLPQEYNPEYGTAGFRSNANNLDAVVFRCSVLMSIRAMITGKYCGVMITASHNPSQDNGVKLIDCNGEMIDTEWQDHATKLAQAKTFELFWQYIQCFNIHEYNSNNNKSKTGILIGIDTRESGHRLAYIAKETANACEVKYTDLGYVTTPELHFYTLQANLQNCASSYTQYLTNAFRCALQVKNNVSCDTLHVDCANGVGALKLKDMYQDLLQLGLRLVLYNTGEGELNYQCGADYVEKEHKFPINMQAIAEGERCCSLDGDADRIVYFTKTNGCFEILNGDKIACLLIKFLSTSKVDSIGLIQTAYANGASTRYITEKFPKVQIQCTHTGVQHLHMAAHQFDIGVYFEANGHGTILFKTNDCCLSQLMSQVTGDAIGNMLAIEYILKTNTSFTEWINLYKDFHTKQEKIYTTRSAFETTDFGRVCIKPFGLQEKINDIIGQYSYANTRAFVRPSGTEDVVRLYVETSQKSCLENVANNIIQAIINNIHIS